MDMMFYIMQFFTSVEFILGFSLVLLILEYLLCHKGIHKFSCIPPALSGAYAVFFVFCSYSFCLVAEALQTGYGGISQQQTMKLVAMLFILNLPTAVMLLMRFYFSHYSPQRQIKKLNLHDL